LLFDCFPQNGREVAAAVLATITMQRVVMDGSASLAQLVPEMPHRREKQNEPLFVTPDVTRFVLDLGHPDGVFPRVKILEDSCLTVQLITENEDQVAHSERLSCRGTDRS
jgi:hypothetical protein